MQNTREQFYAETVRHYLKSLPEKGNAQDPDSVSIEEKAEEWSVPVEAMIAYRDGNNSALEKPLVTALGKLMGYAIPAAGVEGDPDWSSPWPWYNQQNQAAAAMTRNQRYRHFELIDDQRPEGHSALNAWSDLGVTGSVGEDSRHGGGYEPALHASHGQDIRQTMERVARHLNTFVVDEEAKLGIFRGMCKWGVDWEAISLGKVNGRYEVDSLHNRHARTMYHERDEKGGVNPARAYKQCMRPGDPSSDTYFSVSEIALFINRVDRSDLDGTSIFQPGLQSLMQLQAMEAAAVVRRLTRANQVLKRTIDVAHCEGPKEVLAEVERYKRSVQKKRVVDHNRNMQLMRITPPPGEDEIVAKRNKESPADVDAIKGDSSIDQIADITEIFLPKWFACLGPPKAHLGWEGGTMRSVITDLHIVFARKVRRMQMRFIKGLNHLYWISLLLRGIDPRTVRYTIFPPPLGTRDELIRAQIQMMHATTTKYLYDAFGVTGKAPDPLWSLKYLMGMDDEAIQALELKEAIQVTAAAAKAKMNPTSKNPPKEQQEMADAAMTSPAVLEQMDAVGFLLEERALAYRLPSAVAKFERSMAPPFPLSHMEQVCRDLCVREMRAA
jgi:hypothetical protein